MPTPLGHALAGVAVAWFTEAARSAPSDRHTRTTFVVAAAGLAMAPDLDLLYPPIHRMMSHSVSAVLLVAAFAGAIGRAKGLGPWRTATVCGLAYGSHLALDWLGGDTKLPEGIQLLWPFRDTWFISSWGIFRATHLDGFWIPSTMAANAAAVVQEIVILGSLALAAWFVADRGRR